MPIHSYPHNVLILQTPDMVAMEVAQRFVCAAVRGVAEHGEFFVAVPGGNTPRTMFDLLAEPEYAGLVPWDRTHIFLTDERCVPSDHPDSNYGMLRERMLSRVPLPDNHAHGFHTELPPDDAASAYENDIRMVLGDDPVFDLIILGMGADAHIASLFPESPAIDERNRSAAAVFVEKLGSHRLTLTPGIINNSREVVLMVTGQEKSEALRSVFREEKNPSLRPAQVIEPVHGRFLCVADSAATELL